MNARFSGFAGSGDRGPVPAHVQKPLLPFCLRVRSPPPLKLCPHVALVCARGSNWRELALLGRAKAPFLPTPIRPRRIASRVAAKSCAHRDASPRAFIEPPIGAWSAIFHFGNGKFFFNAKGAKGRQDADRSGNEREIHSRGISSRSLRLRGKESCLDSRQAASRHAMAKIRRVSDWPLLTVLSPGLRLAGMPATGADRNDSNGRTGYEAENGSEWQSWAVFKSTRVIRLKSIGRCLAEGIDLKLAAASCALQQIQAKIAAQSPAVKSSRAQIALKSLAYNTKKFFKEFT